MTKLTKKYCVKTVTHEIVIIHSNKNLQIEKIITD